MTLTPAQDYVGPSQGASDLARAIGKTGVYEIGGLQVPVEVLEVTTSYGRPKFLIAPIGGQGSKWVIERLSLLEDKHGD